MIYTFGPFELDSARYELRRSGSLVHVQPRVFDLLHFLVARGGALISRSDLLEHVWGGTTVTKDAIAQAVSAVRTALDDAREQPEYLETIRGRGYRFCAAVTVVDEAPRSHSVRAPIGELAPRPSPARSALDVGARTNSPERRTAAIVAHLRAAIALLGTLEQPAAESATVLQALLEARDDVA
ncbi:winged helix-turn-helix domain-containing protein [Labilithrix luteola]|nr:transcriptional regulator [Labilithrix luteola]